MKVEPRDLVVLGDDVLRLQVSDLEWRLDEIDQYTAWFAAPHAGSASDETAFGGPPAELRGAPVRSAG